ncbi:hypothetical protein AVEN_140966-1 [Araneus ventricosus]|uniref:Uncharacterized protein n=1 Tax=Araneus ventricosus TaxID=182803 RepID=A0A4Y2LMQ5_ARAVE|nr:hypothetical protein AVEN_140966-1 [Araneus ventricosus]
MMALLVQQLPGLDNIMVLLIQQLPDEGLDILVIHTERRSPVDCLVISPRAESKRNYTPLILAARRIFSFWTKNLKSNK